MSFREENILSPTKRITLHDLPVSVFVDEEVPTDSEIGAWVATNFDKDTWDNVLIAYNPPSFTQNPSDLNTFKYLWLVIYNNSIGYPIITRMASSVDDGGGSPGVDGSKWYVQTVPPTGALGVDGDMVLLLLTNTLDPNHGNVYQKVGGSWSLTGNIKGPEGEGTPGQDSNLTIGTVTTVENNVPAAASITGTAPNKVLNLSIPKGADGEDGVDGISPDQPNLTPGTVTTLAPEDNATASISGTYPNWQINLGIPKGVKGDVGDDGFSFTANNVNTNTNLLPWTINVFGVVGVAPATPFTVFLPDVVSNGLNSWIIIVNASTVNITIDPTHGEFVGPNKTTLLPNESITYYSVAVSTVNSNGYIWTALSKY